MQIVIRTIAALLSLSAVFFIGLTQAGESNDPGNCPGFAIAEVNGFTDYHLTSCCYKGCGGACCRCGSANGYQSDCASSCAIGLVEEIQKLKSVSLPNGLIVVGRLIHAQTKKPLPNEKVMVVIAGGKTLIGESGADGTFRIEMPGRFNYKIQPTHVGDLPFVRSSELGENEAKEYRLFLVPKNPAKATS